MFDKATYPLSDDSGPDGYSADLSPVNARPAGQRNAAQASAADPRGILRVVYFFPCGSPVTSTCSFVPTSFSAASR
jgi:hypothetical protein